MPTVRAPGNVRKSHAELVAPEAIAIDGPHDDGAVLVADAYLPAVGVPRHVPNDALVAVVDHLLKPHALVQHPHDDQPVRVAADQLAVLLKGIFEIFIPLLARYIEVGVLLVLLTPNRIISDLLISSNEFPSS